MATLLGYLKISLRWCKQECQHPDVSHLLPLIGGIAILTRLPLFVVSVDDMGSGELLSQILSLGTTAFSGAASMTAGFLMVGTLYERIRRVLLAYSVISIVALLLSTPVAGTYAELMPANAKLLIGIYLISIGTTLTNISLLSQAVTVAGMNAALRLLIVLTATAGVVRTISDTLVWQVDFDAKVILLVGIAIGLGMCLTLLGTLLGYAFRDDNSQDIRALRFLRYGAGATLCLVGLTYLEAPLPIAARAFLVNMPLVAGLIGTVVTATVPQKRHARLSA